MFSRGQMVRLRPVAPVAPVDAMAARAQALTLKHQQRSVPVNVTQFCTAYMCVWRIDTKNIVDAVPGCTPAQKNSTSFILVFYEVVYM